MQKLRKEIETIANNQMELLELKWKIPEAKKNSLDHHDSRLTTA